VTKYKNNILMDGGVISDAENSGFAVVIGVAGALRTSVEAQKHQDFL
jgi:hypothetical protein